MSGGQRGPVVDHVHPEDWQSALPGTTELRDHMHAQHGWVQPDRQDIEGPSVRELHDAIHREMVAPKWELHGRTTCGLSHRMLGSGGDVLCDLPQGHPVDITVRIDGHDSHHQDHANRVDRVSWRERYTARKPRDWAESKGIQIKDPDGWRNETDHYPPQSFGKKISEREFDARAAVSTVAVRPCQHCDHAHQPGTACKAVIGWSAPVTDSPDYRSTAYVCECTGVPTTEAPTTEETTMPIATCGAVSFDGLHHCKLAQGHTVPIQVTLEGVTMTCDHADLDDKLAWYGSEEPTELQRVTAERDLLLARVPELERLLNVERDARDKAMQEAAETNTVQPMAQTIEHLRSELSRVVHERDQLSQRNVTKAGIIADLGRKQRELEGQVSQLRNDRQVARTERDRAIEGAVKMTDQRNQLRRALEDARQSLTEMQPEIAQLVKPGDAVWDFLDWMRIKGWSVSTSWPIGPEAHHATTAEWGSSVLDGLVQGWHWARHGQWAHAEGQKAMQAPEDEGEPTIKPEPGTFAYEHSETPSEETTTEAPLICPSCGSADLRTDAYRGADDVDRILCRSCGWFKHLTKAEEGNRG